MKACYGDDEDEEIADAPPLAMEIEDDDWVIRDDDAPPDIAEFFRPRQGVSCRDDQVEGVRL